MRGWVAALALLCALVLAYTLREAARPPASERPEAAEFQRMTGGLGMGAAAAAYWDFAGFDPRLEADCTCSLWPVPGGWLFSPEHRLTPWDPPEILWDEVAPEPRRGGKLR